METSQINISRSRLYLSGGRDREVIIELDQNFFLL